MKYCLLHSFFLHNFVNNFPVHSFFYCKKGEQYNLKQTNCCFFFIDHNSLKYNFKNPQMCHYFSRHSKNLKFEWVKLFINGPTKKTIILLLSNLLTMSDMFKISILLFSTITDTKLVEFNTIFYRFGDYVPENSFLQVCV